MSSIIGSKTTHVSVGTQVRLFQAGFDCFLYTHRAFRSIGSRHTRFLSAGSAIAHGACEGTSRFTYSSFQMPEYTLILIMYTRSMHRNMCSHVCCNVSMHSCHPNMVISAVNLVEMIFYVATCSFLPSAAHAPLFLHKWKLCNIHWTVVWTSNSTSFQ